MKKCFKCGKEKEIEQFYKHPKMSDGHLGKCKSCTKKDVKKRYYDPVYRDKIRAYEKARSKTEKRKIKTLEYQRKRRKKFPGKNRARAKTLRNIKNGILVRLPCYICGNEKSEAHHTDYRSPLKVTWLCQVCHRAEHKKHV